jgi:hypothetical protein
MYYFFNIYNIMKVSGKFIKRFGIIISILTYLLLILSIAVVNFSYPIDNGGLSIMGKILCDIVLAFITLAISVNFKSVFKR